MFADRKLVKRTHRHLQLEEPSTPAAPPASATPVSTPPTTQPSPQSSPQPPPASQSQGQSSSGSGSQQSSSSGSDSNTGSGSNESSGANGNGGNSGNGVTSGNDGGGGNDGNSASSGNVGNSGSGSEDGSSVSSKGGSNGDSGTLGSQSPSVSATASSPASPSSSQAVSESNNDANAPLNPNASSFTTGADGKSTPLLGTGLSSASPTGDAVTASFKGTENAWASPSASLNSPVIVNGESVTPSGSFSAVSSLQTAPISEGGTNGENGSPGTTGNGSTGSPPGTPGSTSSDTEHHGVSTGVIAAIAVVASLLLLGLVVFTCRRCFISKRSARRGHWFRAHSVYGGGISSSGYFRQRAPSVRSSFGTSYENQPIPTSPPPIPTPSDWSPPSSPMAQTANRPVSYTVASKTASSSSATFHDASEMESLNGNSRASIHSRSSETFSTPQILFVPARGVANEGDESILTAPGTPISVRPFSPTERWSFPKPPSARLPDSALYPAHSPAASPTPGSMGTSDYVTAPDHGDPFADPDPDNSVDMHTTESFNTVDTTSVHFLPVETVFRPFVPTRDDELAVVSGDTVHVVKRYDDGWAYAVNRSTGQRGLFPIDCLRMADQDLPAFLAAKRISSYGVNHRISDSTAAVEYHAM
ncbi:hypothetical protein EIP86_003682 [Pleurotus ostreatoroseus]|nr:hypothetical protein EIP86_003682 [Pleurotus ostreatoroseus]